MLCYVMLCRSLAGPGMPIPRRHTVTTRPHFGFSGCKPAAEECVTHIISCNWPGGGLDYLEAAVIAGWSLVSGALADRPSPVRGEQVMNLVGSSSNLRTLWCWTEVLAWANIDHTSINGMKISVNTPTDTINELLNVGWQRNKWLGAIFAKNT